jgi:hypothetical protein
MWNERHSKPHCHRLVVVILPFFLPLFLPPFTAVGGSVLLVGRDRYVAVLTNRSVDPDRVRLIKRVSSETVRVLDASVRRSTVIMLDVNLSVQC